MSASKITIYRREKNIKDKKNQSWLFGLMNFALTFSKRIFLNCEKKLC